MKRLSTALIGMLLTTTLAAPAVSAARPVMVWVSQVQGGFDVVVLYSDGSVSEPLNDPNPSGSFPTISPDGNRVAFVGWTHATVPRVGRQYAPVASIFIADLLSGAVKPIYEEDGTQWEIASPEWSPNGTQIMFVRYPLKKAGEAGKHSDLWILNEVSADAWAAEPFITRPGSEGWPEWSPDGRSVTYEYDPDDDGLHESGESRWSTIAISPADGSGWHRQLLPVGPPRYVTDPVFSPDGRRIAYADYPAFWSSPKATTGGRIRTMRVDGTGIKTIVSDLRSPWALDYSPDGRFIAWGDATDTSASRILQVEVRRPENVEVVVDTNGYDHLPEYFPQP